MNIAAEIRAEVGRQRISLTDLANATGSTKQKLSRQINTEEQKLEIPDLTAIAAALNLRVSDLVIRAEENSQEAVA